MPTRIQRIQFPDHRRIMMISDIHGHAAGLKAVLKQADFGQQDILVIVGDMVEKGPETLRTIRDVMALCEAYTVYPLIGNVDLSRLQMIMSDDVAIQQKLLNYSIDVKRWWPTSFLEEMCAEIGLTMDEQLDTARVFPQLRAHFAKELAFLDGLPAILETQRFIFVHGGIPHERLHELEGEECASLLKRDAFWEEGLSFDKYVAVGHWPVALYCDDRPCHNPLIDHKRHILCLDGGCGIKKEGQLNLLCLPEWRSDDFTCFTWDELPEVVALEAQEESVQSCNIRWTRELPSVSVLENQGEVCRIRYREYELDVPASFLWMQDGRWYCDDITDYLLPVQPGDRLKVIVSNALGSYVKKNGTVGWYKGCAAPISDVNSSIEYELKEVKQIP